MATIVKRRGVWVLDYRNAVGVRCRLKFNSKGDAEREAKTLVPLTTARGQRRRTDVDGRVDFETWARQWFHTLGGTKARTSDGYAWVAERYLIPTLGAVRVADLDAGRIAECARMLLERGRAFTTGPNKGAPGAGPLGKRTVGLALTVLSSCLATAVRAKLLPSNPVAGLARELRLTTTKVQRRARMVMRILSADELVTLERYTAAHEPAWLPLVLTYTRTGLRCGEAIALEIGDFSASGGGSLRVRQAVNMKTGALDVPKTGPRVVDLGLSGELVAVLVAQVAGLRKAGRIPWLFPSTCSGANAGRVTHRRVERAIARLGTAAGIGHGFSVHDLRHTYATLLLNTPGMDPFFVSRQLGHASIAETCETYGVTAQPRLAPQFVGLFDRGLALVTAEPAQRVRARSGHKVVTNGAAGGSARLATVEKN